MKGSLYTVCKFHSKFSNFTQVLKEERNKPRRDKIDIRRLVTETELVNLDTLTELFM